MNTRHKNDLYSTSRNWLSYVILRLFRDRFKSFSIYILFRLEQIVTYVQDFLYFFLYCSVSTSLIDNGFVLITSKTKSFLLLLLTTLFSLSQEAAGEELRHTALTKRVLNARQITMTEHDLFKGQAFEDQVSVEISLSFTFHFKLANESLNQ